jgi:hypothetical protein
MMITDTKHVFEYVADEFGLTEGVDYDFTALPTGTFEKLAREIEEIARTQGDTAAEKHIRRALQTLRRAESAGSLPDSVDTADLDRLTHCAHGPPIIAATSEI